MDPILIRTALLAVLLAAAAFFLGALAYKLAPVRWKLVRPLACALCTSFWSVLLCADVAQYAVAPALRAPDVLALAGAIPPACGIALFAARVSGALRQLSEAVPFASSNSSAAEYRP